MISSNTDWRERALRAEAELQRLSFVAGNIGIEHPEWPPEYARHLAALSSFLTSVTVQRDAAVEALKEVMIWIDNWSPDFIYDDEWSETNAKVIASLDTEGATNDG